MLRDKIKSYINELDGVASVIVKDLDGGEKISFNEEIVFPAASIIKLSIIWELFKKIDSNKISWNDEVTMDETHKVKGFGILKELHSGIKLSVEDLATLMIILSDNVATNILIDILGMDSINRAVEKIGLKNTTLQRKMMDVEAKKRGLDNLTTAMDTAIILEKLLESNKIIDILKRQQCNNKLPALIDSNVQFPHKTGDLPGIEHDAGIMFLENCSVIVVVMTKNLKKNDDGVKFNNDIGKAVYDYFR